MFRPPLVVLSLVAVVACASIPDARDRPGVEYAGCYLLENRHWPAPPEGIRAPNPIYLNGPDTLQLQTRLGYGPGLVITTDAEGHRLSDEEVRRQYDQSRPLLIYPRVTVAIDIDDSTWELVAEDHLLAHWTMGFQSVGGPTSTVRVELKLHLDPRAEPLRGFAERAFFRGGFRGVEEGHLRTDSVALVATKFPCPSEFPYVLPPPRVRDQ